MVVFSQMRSDSRLSLGSKGGGGGGVFARGCFADRIRS